MFADPEAGFVADLDAAARAVVFRRPVFTCAAERLAAVRFFAAPLAAGLADGVRRTGFAAVERPAALRPVVLFALERLLVAFRDARFATLPPVKTGRLDVSR